MWFIFARLYFNAIYLTKVWQWFADDRMDSIISSCDFYERFLGGSSGGASVVVIMAGMFASLAILNNVVQMSFKKRLVSIVVIALAIALDIGVHAWSINCYHNELFSLEIKPRPYPFLNPGQTNFTLVN